MSNQSYRLLGIDPGLRVMGWGVVQCAGQKLTHIANGSVASNAADDLATRLLTLEQGLEKVFDEHAPDFAAVEQSFVNKDGAASLKLGHARAVCLLTPARRGVAVFEYAPTHIKQAVVGSGGAGKHQIAAMLSVLLPLATPKDEHAADALAVAITLAHRRDFAPTKIRESA